MSYARWSSMNYECAVYVYADVNGGYTCHVAGMKCVGDTPIPYLPETLGEIPIEEWMAIHQKQNEWIRNAKRVPIGLPHDGESFYNQDRDSMVETLKMLKAEGYLMPDYLIDAIASEDDDE